MGEQTRELISSLDGGARLDATMFERIINDCDSDDLAFAMKRANAKRKEQFGDEIFIRGLVEFTNYCRNDCLYCGIRRSNQQVERYRLTAEQIMECLEQGYSAEIRTLVLQGGEDTYFNDARVCALVSEIKSRHPDIAVTLSIGERPYESYMLFREAGADRYLLRHETATEWHYAKLHPSSQTLASRMECLRNLKALGFQVGCGMMVGSPFQTAACLAQDLAFIQDFRPHMVGIGPFIPHKATPFANESAGTVEQTLLMLSLVRLMHPKVLLPSTTALATLHPGGRLKGIMAGANVVMPNLSPLSVRGNYTLYDNKANTGLEAVEGLAALSRELDTIGCTISKGRGDAPA